jgi:E3 ubiquitin-protein ligase TRIP12
VGHEYEGRDDDDEDPFGGFGGPGGPPHGLSTTLRALSGMMTGVSSRLREILNNLKQKDDPSMQLIALQELSEILLVSTEDNLSGHFSPDAFVKELVVLMQPSDFGEENPEMMLLACRCLANLMEALPASTANVVYGGAVPVLCAKLLEIHFIDLAEQALSVGYSHLYGCLLLTYILDTREDLGRVPGIHCARRRTDCLPDLPRLLRDEYPENRGHYSCQLLSKYP